MTNNIFILSAPVHSGKTTALMEFWEMGRISCDGFLTPDIDESRKLIFLDTDEELPFQLENEFGEDALKVGQYIFSQSTFNLAKKKISELHNSNSGLLIIDEIGILEMEGKGFEPELSDFIEKFKLSTSNTLLILVIRNTLLIPAIESYRLQDAPVLSLKLFIEKFIPE